MKKKLISVLLTLAVAGTMLAGCGNSKADDTKSEADSSRERNFFVLMKNTPFITMTEKHCHIVS